MSTTTPITRRVAAVDLGRGLAVLLMIPVHTLWMYADKAVQTDAWLGHLVHFIGKGSAAFLICMGISLVLARNQSARYLLLRGIQILALGFLLNACKFVIPTALGLLPEAFIQAYGWHMPLDTAQYTYLLLTGDILQLAGATLLLLSALQPWLHNKTAMLALALTIAASAKLLAGLQLGISGVDYVLRLVFSASWQVYFPVFPWASFIFFGLFLGIHLRQNQNNQGNDTEQLNRLPWIAVPMLVIGGALCYSNFAYHFGDFFHLGPGGVFYLLGINLLLLWCINKVALRGINNRFVQWLNYCSRRVTSLYFIQWTVICWGMSVIGYQTLNTHQTCAAMLASIALTFAIQRLVDLAKQRRPANKNTPFSAPETIIKPDPAS
ncbi:hypothetical protein R50072_27220 [Simiduia litorea]|uniref:heparan-alpha-glucosaminide N-acetyltransferase domain-containing protein n=1 Tax=Simiduia litorea TaxID=1435348 RepID=UPI0036F29B17